MDGITACIDGCDACWGKNDEVLVDFLLNLLQECGFTCTCLSCQEETYVCVLDELISHFLLLVVYVVCHDA